MMRGDVTISVTLTLLVLHVAEYANAQDHSTHHLVQSGYHGDWGGRVGVQIKGMVITNFDQTNYGGHQAMDGEERTVDNGWAIAPYYACYPGRD
jgi:hypothetical protein